MVNILYNISLRFIQYFSIVFEKPSIEFYREKFSLQNLLCHILREYSHFEMRDSTFSDVLAGKMGF